uniref:Uncharacterized protein n=1 Tax=Cacopsylla melanoneura TaxID=428564 RepID=A0A8D9ABG5_9HEMI
MSKSKKYKQLFKIIWACADSRLELWLRSLCACRSAPPLDTCLINSGRRLISQIKKIDYVGFKGSVEILLWMRFLDIRRFGPLKKAACGAHRGFSDTIWIVLLNILRLDHEKSICRSWNDFGSITSRKWGNLRIKNSPVVLKKAL